MTKILRIIQSSDPKGGGPMEGALRFAQVWSESGHRQDLVTLEPEGSPIRADYPGEIFHLGRKYSNNLLSKYRYSPKVVPWLKENASNYDAIIVSGLWRYQVLAARKALRNSLVPYFVFPHGMLDPWFNKSHPYKFPIKQISWWVAEGPLLKNASAVLFTSEEEMLSARGVFKPYQLNEHVISYGAYDPKGDEEKQRRDFLDLIPELSGKRYLLYLGRIHEKKGCDILLAAFAKLANTNYDVQLVLAGPDKHNMIPNLKLEAERLGVSDRVFFPGMLSGDVKVGAFRNAEAFVLPSHQENFGIAVAEALAVGIPVLVSEKVNIWREIVSSGAGLAGPDTEEGTCRLLQEYFSLSVEARLDMGRKARLIFTDRFDVRKAAQSLLAYVTNESR